MTFFDFCERLLDSRFVVHYRTLDKVIFSDLSTYYVYSSEDCLLRTFENIEFLRDVIDLIDYSCSDSFKCSISDLFYIFFDERI